MSLWIPSLLEWTESDGCGADVKILETDEGVLLDVYVKPNSKKFKIETENDELVVWCRGIPIGGRVNRELINELSRLFGKRVILVSGFASRQKKVLIRDAHEKEVGETLSSYARSEY